MQTLTVERDNRTQLSALLSDENWLVACLCAAWCDTCNAYRANFDALAARHPTLGFAWIDIEDQADLVGDLDVENFPTLLIQRGPTVAFFGAIPPDLQVAERLILAQTSITDAELQRAAISSPERQSWQRDCNLKLRLQIAGDS
ncbi:MAG: thioredoxin family protein [Herbaspirillum sp.]